MYTTSSVLQRLNKKKKKTSQSKTLDLVCVEIFSSTQKINSSQSALSRYILVLWLTINF